MTTKFEIGKAYFSKPHHQIVVYCGEGIDMARNKPAYIFRSYIDDYKLLAIDNENEVEEYERFAGYIFETTNRKLIAW